MNFTNVPSWKYQFWWLSSFCLCSSSIKNILEFFSSQSPFMWSTNIKDRELRIWCHNIPEPSASDVTTFRNPLPEEVWAPLSPFLPLFEHILFDVVPLFIQTYSLIFLQMILFYFYVLLCCYFLPLCSFLKHLVEH